MEIYNVNIKKEHSYTSVKINAINEFEAVEYAIQEVLKNKVADVLEIDASSELNYTHSTIGVDVDQLIDESTINLSNLFIKFDGKYFKVYYKRFGTYFSMGSKFDTHHNAELFKSLIDKQHVIDAIAKEISG